MAHYDPGLALFEGDCRHQANLTYTRQFDTRNLLLVGLTDADWAANDYDHARAVTGYVLFMSGAAISWLTAFR